MMPADQRHETDRNPDMIANVVDKRQCVDFVLMMDVRIVLANGKVKGMTLPNRQTFEDRIGEAINIMIKENMEWCNVVEESWFIADSPKF